MEWKRKKFYITCRDSSGLYRELVSGVVSVVGVFPVGINKDENGNWNVTDIDTGYSLHVSFTQREAKAWVESAAEVIIEILSRPGHAELMEEVSKCQIRT